MKTICLYFQIHQPFRYRRYRFFEIGNSHYYYDDYSNESIMRKIATKCYLPANKVLLDLFKEYGCRFKVAFSISGTALDQFELYAPDVLESFQKLAQTNCVEFLSETYSHSLSSLKNKDEFFEQVKAHDQRIEKYFKRKPVVFRNTELIYNDEIGEWIAEMGFKAAITEGAKHILGWKSPNYVYCNAANPRLKLLLKNYRLSDDIAFRFSDRGWNEFPLTADKFVSWINAIDPKDEIVNLFMNYETFGGLQPKESGIFEFLKAFPKVVLSTNKFTFGTPSEIIEKYQPVAPLAVAHPISWADEERDVSAWLGNELQKEAASKLYLLRDKVREIDDEKIQIDWRYLQTSDHFYYMCTKFFIHGSMHAYFNPYSSPYDAFINYMNILSDFELRLNAYSQFNIDVKKTKKQEPKTKVSEIKKEVKNTKTAIKTTDTALAKTAPKAELAKKGKQEAKKPTAKPNIKETKNTLKALPKANVKSTAKPVANKADTKPIAKSVAKKGNSKKVTPNKAGADNTKAPVKTKTIKK